MNNNFDSPVIVPTAADSWKEIFVLPDDSERFAGVVELLAENFNEPVIITGSFAVEWQLREKNGYARKRRLNDIDVVVADGLAGVGRGFNSFLIHHFHPTRELGNVLIQLVEPRTRTRVDVFSPRSPSVRERVRPVNISGIECEVLSAEDLALRLLAIVGIVLDGESVDPKYLDSLERIMGVADTDLTARLWTEYRRGGDPSDHLLAFDAVQRTIRDRPELLKPVEYSQDVEAQCPWCVENEDFPIASRSDIFEILGYI